VKRKAKIRDNLDFGMVRPIADTILGASAASIDFTSIPQTFAHLLLVVQARGDAVATNVDLFARCNGDAAGNYDYEQAFASASAMAVAESLATAGGLYLGGIAAASASAAGHNGCSFAVIPNYAKTTLEKLATIINSYKYGTTTGTVRAQLLAAFWRSTVAINQLTVRPSSGNLAAGTRATLIGMGGI